MKRSRLFSALLLLVCSACNVPYAPERTRGIDLAPAGDCARGFVVLESQYQSTNVAILDRDGAVLSGSFLASEAESGGLFASLSGDVVPMSSPASGSYLPLVDRAGGAGAIYWADFQTGDIVNKLMVDTGFPSYPQDYAPISADKAYVPRLGHNLSAGEVAFDTGSDLLIIDPMVPAITGAVDMRVALGDDAVDNLPRPGRVVVNGGRAFVLLATLPTRSFSATTSSRLAIVNTASDELEGAVVLEGLHNCSGLALSPTGGQIAVFCSALVDAKGGTEPEFSGIALVDVRDQPVVQRVLSSTALGARSIGFYGDYATESLLLVTAFGAYGEHGEAIAQDGLLRIDLTTDTADTILESEETPFSLGGVACDAACGVCLVADASRDGGVVHRYEVSAEGTLADVSTIKVERDIGLPPRYIGRF